MLTFPGIRHAVVVVVQIGAVAQSVAVGVDCLIRIRGKFIPVLRWTVAVAVLRWWRYWFAVTESVNQFRRIGAFIAVLIISGGSKIIRTTVVKILDRLFGGITDIDTVGIIAAGSTVVNIVAGQIRFAIGIP